MIKSVWKCINNIAISPKRGMEQAEIIDTFWTYQLPDSGQNYPQRNKDMFLGYGGDKEFIVKSSVDASFDTDLDDSES